MGWQREAPGLAIATHCSLPVGQPLNLLAFYSINLEIPSIAELTLSFMSVQRLERKAMKSLL